MHNLTTYFCAGVTNNLCQFSLEDANNPVLRGQAVIYDAISSDITGGMNVYDIFKPGSFDVCLKQNPDVIALYNHNTDNVLGRVSNGRLKINASAQGLNIELTPSNTSYARDLIELVKDGTVRGMSFGARIKDFDWDLSDKKKSYRLINQAELFEVTFTAIPSFVDTHAEVVLRSREKLNDLAAEQRQRQTLKERYSDRLRRVVLSNRYRKINKGR